jgi:hypothetical protein
MSDVQINTQAVRFPCMTWEVQGESIQPVKATWSLPPMHLRHIFERLGVEDKVRGLVSCPNCGKTSIVTTDLVTEDKIAHTATLPLLRCSDCPFACEAVFEEWDQRKLYCVAYETTSEPLIKEYFHGFDTKDVGDQFWNGHLHDRNIVRVIGIAIVIGYFVDDNKGLKLHV